jgi:hypothetical protein
VRLVRVLRSEHEKGLGPVLTTMAAADLIVVKKCLCPPLNLILDVFSQPCSIDRLNSTEVEPASTRPQP